MGQCIRIINVGRHLVSILPVEMTEHILITFLTGTKSNDLNRILTQFIHDISDQIQALLVCQSGYQTNHHLLIIYAKSQLFLQGTLILHLFLAEIHCIIGFYDIFVCLRIELSIVDTIDDTAQIMTSRTQQSVQTLTVERRLDLLRIGITYGSHRIREYDTALQQVCILISL